jgi:predicted nucleotidyltransferase component of viral defense system
MSRKGPPANLAASVRARLDDLRKRKGLELELVLSEFAIERLLFRLGISPYAERFVLKGATLFRLWSDQRGRATWDLDLLGRDEGDVEAMVQVIRELCVLNSEDGLEFPPDLVSGEEIRIPDEFGGVRIRMEARLGTACIPIQIDIGFGDAVVPPPQRTQFPVLLDLAAPEILVYPKETVVAEKFSAMITKGVTNTRMKDFYDVDLLSRTQGFQGTLLVKSLKATFARRGLPREEPVALEPGFLISPLRAPAWKAFLRRGRLGSGLDAEALHARVREFLLPVWQAASEELPFSMSWLPGGPWRPGEENGDS